MTTEPITNDNNLNQPIIQWGRAYLLSHGYKLKSDLPELVQDTPWSYVIRFVTYDGYVYLKHTPKLLALEADIINILQNQFHAHVPKIIAKNDELDCFLMKDAGKSLRGILKKNFSESLLCKTASQFTSLQIDIADHVDVFLNIGVPDWRLNKIPDLYKQLLSQKDLLIEDGLSEKEIKKLEMLLPTVTALCNKLSDYSIRETIVQPDFNDNNTLIEDLSQVLTIIDLGEIAISHPFFSLLNFLYQIQKHYGLTDKDNTYLTIKEACLHPFMASESRENVLHALELARPLWFVYGALAGYRLMIACGKENMMSFQHGKFIASLRDFMAECH